MIKIYNKISGDIVVFASLLDGLAASHTPQKMMIVSPHDDDACIGAGLLIAQAVNEELDVSLVVVTRGDQGYCELDEKESIEGIQGLGV